MFLHLSSHTFSKIELGLYIEQLSITTVEVVMALQSNCLLVFPLDHLLVVITVTVAVGDQYLHHFEGDILKLIHKINRITKFNEMLIEAA